MTLSSWRSRSASIRWGGDRTRASSKIGKLPEGDFYMAVMRRVGPGPGPSPAKRAVRRATPGVGAPGPGIAPGPGRPGPGPVGPSPAKRVTRAHSATSSVAEQACLTWLVEAPRAPRTEVNHDYRNPVCARSVCRRSPAVGAATTVGQIEVDFGVTTTLRTGWNQAVHGFEALGVAHSRSRFPGRALALCDDGAGQPEGGVPGNCARTSAGRSCWASKS